MRHLTVFCIDEIVHVVYLVISVNSVIAGAGRKTNAESKDKQNRFFQINEN